MKNKHTTEIQEVTELISQVVECVRAQLSITYNVDSEGYQNFAGLCDTASSICSDCIKDEIDKHYGLDIEVKTIHGEQSHHPRIPSRKWAIQHTWMKVMLPDYTIYVDPTSGQFQHLYHDIPDFYISTEKPYWYYPDRSNPVWNGITKYLNDKIKFRRVIKFQDKDLIVHNGIIEILQFDVWGNISDFIRKFIYD